MHVSNRLLPLAVITSFDIVSGVMMQISIHQVVKDGILPAMVFIDLHRVDLLYFFDALPVEVFNRDGASELGIQR
ncbi:hypothetical protein L3X38_036431 [Prunus dulcis]|uniref:Uncharacterized protein n=1 Tax=Prunus dulcis TaxID=3755 RepID=A0AAD4V1G7_PRUDU|nr:hypothetical protein L3X38_036431 [Prunus dulcis]